MCTMIFKADQADTFTQIRDIIRRALTTPPYSFEKRADTMRKVIYNQTSYTPKQYPRTESVFFNAPNIGGLLAHRQANCRAVYGGASNRKVSAVFGSRTPPPLQVVQNPKPKEAIMPKTSPRADAHAATQSAQQSNILSAASLALSYLDASDKSLWVKIAQALKSEFGDDEFSAGFAFTLFDQWSASASDYNRKAVKTLWKSLKSSSGVSIGTLFDEAKQRGCNFNLSEMPDLSEMKTHFIDLTAQNESPAPAKKPYAPAEYAAAVGGGGAVGTVDDGINADDANDDADDDEVAGFSTVNIIQFAIDNGIIEFARGGNAGDGAVSLTIRVLGGREPSVYWQGRALPLFDGSDIYYNRELIIGALMQQARDERHAVGEYCCGGCTSDDYYGFASSYIIDLMTVEVYLDAFKCDAYWWAVHGDALFARLAKDVDSAIAFVHERAGELLRGA